MVEVEVLRVADERFQVTVREDDGETQHDVTTKMSDVGRLGSPYGSAEEFVRACFEFLLAREAKESILRVFDIRDIMTYFPEFEREIASG